MAGLLDLNDPTLRLGLGLMAAGGPSAVPQSMGQRLFGLLGQLSAEEQAKEDRKQKQAMQALQMQHLGGQIRDQDMQSSQRQLDAEQKAKALRLIEEFRSQIPSPEMSASSAALSGGGGPTNANAARMQAPDPNQMLLHKGMQAGLVSPMDYVNSLRKDTTPIKLGAGETLLKPGTFEPLYTAPHKPAEDPSEYRLFQLSGGPQRGLSFDQWDQARRRAGAASTHVSLGSPVPITLPNGEQALVQPANRPGEPPQIMRMPGTNEILRPPPKEMPSALREKLAQNEVTLGKIDAALTAVQATPGAVGLQNVVGDTVMQRLHPKGVEARALVADIGSQKIHDRSGAAVTAAETPRLKPFIPSATDTPETVQKKLTLFRREYAAMTQAINAGASIQQVSKPAGQSAAPSLEDLLKKYGN